MAKENPKPPVEEKGSLRSIFQEYSEAFVVAIILAIIIRAFLIQAFKIPSESMLPTLLKGDHILVNKFIYGVRVPFLHSRWPAITSPKRGDVIVFVFPKQRSKDFIKRVVAVEGDTLQVINKELFINGKKQTEPFIQHADSHIIPATPPLTGGMNVRDNTEPITVPKNKLFVMGDNRDYSLDSRFWGFVPLEDVKGKAFLIYFSIMPTDGLKLSEIYKLVHYIRWNRLFDFIS